MRQTSGVPRPEIEGNSARERRLWPRFAWVEPLRLRHSPLLFAAISFALGEALTIIPPHVPRATLLLFAGSAALLALTLLALRCSLRLAAPAVLALWMAAGLWSAQVQPGPSPQTALLAYADGLSRTVEGRVVRVRPLPATAPDSSSDFDADGWDEESGGASSAIDLDVSAIEQVTPDASWMAPVRGGVRATLFNRDASAPTLRCGDLVAVPLRLRAPERYRDPGAWQYADYLLQQNIAATAGTADSRLRVLPATRTSAAARARCAIFAAQSWAAERLPAYVRSAANRHLPAPLRLSPEDAGMLNAMLFGDRSRLDRNMRLGFERTGSFHLFVVSGMHVALLAGLLYWVARRLGLFEWLATLLTLLLVAAYALLTGLGIPVERALLMTTVFLLARLLSRERNALNALGAAALAVLIASPRALFEASFQMTFLAVIAIAGIAMPLAQRSFLPYARATRNLSVRWRDLSLPPRVAQFRTMLRYWSEALEMAFGRRFRHLHTWLIRAVLFAIELALVGVIAEAAMVLPMALYFHRATLFALPANMLSVPLVAVLAPLGMLTFLAALLAPWIAAVPAAALALLLHGLTAAIGRISRSQAADLRVPGPVLWHALAACVCIGLCCWAVRRSRRWAMAGVAALALAVIAVLMPSRPDLHPQRLEVTAIDVGQGDSLLVVGPEGRTMLVDAGGPTGAAANAENAALRLAGGSGFDVGEEVVSPYLWWRQLRRLDVVALTHAHSDHMGGMPAVLRNFRPRELWVAVDPNSAPYRAMLAEAAELGIHVRHLRAGDRFAWDGMQISVLAPEPAYANPGPPVNNDSLVMRIVYGQASALLEGDAEAPSEHQMAVAAASGTGLPVGPDTLLKVGHHGSRTSTTPEFLALAAPREAVISVGRNNTFGHPRPEVIQRLADERARVFRTDQFGLTTFLLSRDGGISAAGIASNR